MLIKTLPTTFHQTIKKNLSQFQNYSHKYQRFRQQSLEEKEKKKMTDFFSVQDIRLLLLSPPLTLNTTSWTHLLKRLLQEALHAFHSVYLAKDEFPIIEYGKGNE